MLDRAAYGSRAGQRRGDAAPYCCPIVIILGSELAGPRLALLEGLVAVSLEHEGWQRAKLWI